MIPKLIAILPALLLLLSQAMAQSKYSASLKLFLASEEKDQRFIETRNNQAYIALFIEINEGGDFDLLKKQGLEIRTVAGTIATASIPLDRLQAIANLPAIKRLELPLLFRRHNDTLMKTYTTVDKVLAGMAPLNMPYTGKGILIGIIDDGIEFGHPDFVDSTGKTKIEAIWNMDRNGDHPPGFNYGTLWERDTLNTFLTPAYHYNPPHVMHNLFGYANHGTPVAALAAGEKGVAPDASLVGVALTAFTDTLLRSDRIIDAIAFIYQRAKAAEKKCVINISLGTQWGGPHDGKTLVEKAIDLYSKDKPDLLVCVSAGNDGNNWKHWGGFPIHADSSFGFARLAYGGDLYFTIPKHQSSSLFVSITDSRSPQLNAPAISRDSILYQTPYLRIDNIINSTTPIQFTSYLKNGQPSASFRFTASHYSDDYDELIISLREFTSPPLGNIDWHIHRFIFKGSGTVHGYFPFFNLHPLYHFGVNPYPNDPTYRSTDCAYTSGIPSNAFTVLSSGAYNIRNCYVNPLQNVAVHAYFPCQLTYFTSHGPTLDGRIKPDILSPGENVLSANSRWTTFYGHQNIIDYSYQMFSGTSASSPITAGIAALVWQRFPSFDRDQVINRIKSTAYVDSFARVFGPIPSNVAGWGKIDAFKALTDVSTDVSGVCKQWLTCTVDRDPPPPPAGPVPENTFRFYPNPSNGEVTVEYRSNVLLKLSIYNMLGQLVHVATLPPSPALQRTDLWLNHLAAGLYFVRCQGVDFEQTGKLIISR
ncbi:MAG TPA: S8/S53 family peptidase [Chitinophagaceae bacterium]|nr:S8/S53 family peptidase [Chitinophagaceae bacterium]